MATKKKMLMSSAGAAGAGGGAGLDIDEVFSTYLYDGNGSAQTITNDIDLAGEGGLVWMKARTDGSSHSLQHKTTHYMASNETGGESATTNSISSFNSNGFTLGSYFQVNHASHDYASWTFRKAPKFFDVVTYTGTGSAQNISHDLGSVPGMIIVKDLDTGGNWRIYHRSVGNQYGLDFSTAAKDDDVYWNDTTPTDTVFTVGAKGDTNSNSTNYVAYLFAHNDGDGEFGPSGNQDIIKCGSYTGNGSDDGPEIDLGFEPQWLLVKSADQANKHWQLADVMREWRASGQFARLRPHRSDAEDTANNFRPTATGFKLTATGSDANTSGGTYIYMAIRRGPLAPPESATEVFDVNKHSSNNNSNLYNTGFNADMNINTSVSSVEPNYIIDRLRGKQYLSANTTGAEVSSTATFWDQGNNLLDLKTNWWSTITGVTSWSWKRAPGYFDVVAYTASGNGTTISHNLGVEPELAIFKNLTTAGPDWVVHAPNLGTDGFLLLNSTNAVSTASNWYSATADQITFSTAYSGTATSGDNYISYLFASLPGISKVGSYTGNGSSQTIDCGFTSGARFVLIKAASTTGDWQVFDTTRGIVAGGDHRLELNTTAAEDQPDDIDPASSGFALTIRDEVNKNGETFIFYAIA